MSERFGLLSLLVCVSPAIVLPAAAQASARGPAQASEVRELRVPGKRSVGRVWNERAPSGELVPHFSVSTDGEHFSSAQATDYGLRLRFARFDPRTAASAVTSAVPATLRASVGNQLFIVQCWTQVLADWREALREAGAEVHLFLPNHAEVVSLDAAARVRVAALPFVRALTPFHPAYKLEEELLAGLGEGRSGPITVNLLTLRRGGQAPVVSWIEANGGTIEHVSEPTYLMSATLDFQRLPALAALDEVQWIDRWFAPAADMNHARQLHGADYVEATYGLTGQGVRVEVMDGGFDTTHPDMQDFLIHNNNSPVEHGTCTSGIVVGKGLGNVNARGAAPDAFLVVADYDFAYAGGSRYSHTGQLVNPALAYKCVLQSNSWGSGLTTAYNSSSQNMDLILFDHARISICQSQSNNGDRNSRPEAWAKNIISVGAVLHRNTTTMVDDDWAGFASIGPAADGRIKPDVASFYDSILCPDMVGVAGYSTTNYYTDFGGTSGATPIVAGHLALIYQMWNQGLFGNAHPGATVFENAPYNTTAKALLINGAKQWTFNGAAHDLTRVHQGWGAANLERLVTTPIFVVDEADVLANLQSKSYVLVVVPGEAQLHATLVYRDPPGTTSASQHRINDLDLVLTSPSNVVYGGNNGLLANMFSPPGGSADTKNTVENVLLQTPEVGPWTVTVTATDVNQDTHLETPAEDVDFALVVTGAELPTTPPAAPSHLRGRASSHRAGLSFQDESFDEQGFELERSPDGLVFAPLVTLAAGDDAHDDIGLTPGTSYFYRLRAFNAFGVSAWSNAIEVKTTKSDVSAGPP